jgi:Tripartite tricarboxylate transporter family receptor
MKTMIMTSTNTKRPAQIGSGMPGLWRSPTPTVHAVNIPRMFPGIVMASARESPQATPAEIVEKLNKEINAGLADPKIRARLADLGGAVLALSPADFEKLIADETEKWGKVVKFVGIKPQ